MISLPPMKGLPLSEILVELVRHGKDLFKVGDALDRVTVGLTKAGSVCDRVEKFGFRATESFESLQLRIRLKFCQNSGKF